MDVIKIAVLLGCAIALGALYWSEHRARKKLEQEELGADLDASIVIYYGEAVDEAYQHFKGLCNGLEEEKIEKLGEQGCDYGRVALFENMMRVTLVDIKRAPEIKFNNAVSFIDVNIEGKLLAPLLINELKSGKDVILFDRER